jgi:purine-binding chemotaxis protein CheW
MRQRFNVLSQLPPAVEAAQKDPPVQLCAFSVGAQEYGVDIMRVVEMLPPQRIHPIPGAPTFIEGVIHQRGGILPVVDLRKRLLGPHEAPAEKWRLLVCRLGRRRVAFVVDRVSEVLRLRRGDIKPAPGLGSVGQAPYIVGVYGPPERLRLLLDVKALLRMELAREEARRARP